MNIDVDPMDENLSCLRNVPRCSASSKRTGCRCRAPAMTGKTVCQFHGGKSVRQMGTDNGRYRHGRRTAEAIAERQWMRDFIGEARELAQLLS